MIENPTPSQKEGKEKAENISCSSQQLMKDGNARSDNITEVNYF